MDALLGDAILVATGEVEKFARIVDVPDRPGEDESAYPRPRDRCLSRKTRAAVGKPLGSTAPGPAVSSADTPAAIAVPIGNQEYSKKPLLLLQTI